MGGWIRGLGAAEGRGDRKGVHSCLAASLGALSSAGKAQSAGLWPSHLPQAARGRGPEGHANKGRALSPSKSWAPPPNSLRGFRFWDTYMGQAL